MVCPYCGAEMENGVLESARRIYWNPKAVRVIEFSAVADPLTESRSCQNPYVPASRCPQCRKIILSY